ncbi:MAG: UvrD-helicase domain-containing protein [Planctomycetes bacterium]|nr:UvrD-helicase domain-containing protein [Planctomycetota bacterium]
MDSRPKYTDQQSAAITTRGVSIALSAGAGCGKTFVLTQRFLSGLEPGNVSTTIRSMVAITFTDRAAREMRDRIRSACHQRLEHCEGEAVEHWLQILRGLDSARISTIHSFCTSLLRSQAVDAGLDPRFSVLQPSLADTLLRNTAKETLHGLLEQSNEDAAEFVLKFGLERARELIRALVAQRFQISFASFQDQTAESLAAGWRSRWETEFVPKLVAEFRASGPTEHLFELLRDNQPTHPTMMERRLVLLEWLEPSRPWTNPVAVLQAITENARVQGGGRADTWPTPEVYEDVKTTLGVVRDEARDLAADLSISNDDLLLAAEFSARALRLAHQTADAYEQAKQAQGLLDFDDLLLRARDLLRDRPDVRERVAGGIRLLMVDEFQDTDPVQADVVRMLCGEALTAGRLFLVGDAKQSIYRFRRADPGVFDRLRHEIPPTGRLPLSVNFRSQPAVLNFVNHLFAAGMGDHYEALTPFESVQRSPTPAIEFLFALYDSEETVDKSRTDALDDDLAGPGKASASDLRTREADWIARRCAELLADPTPRIRDKDEQGNPVLRCVKPGDIVILFRALSNVHEYETALRRYGLDYYLVGGKAFFAQQEIFDLLNLCRYLDDPDDLIGLVGVLRSPFFNLSDDSIQSLVLAAPERDRGNAFDRPTLHDGLQGEPPGFLSEEQRWRISFARDVLTDLRAQKDRLPLSKLLALAIERTGYDAAVLTEHLGSRKVANLRKLMDMAQEFDRAELFTLKDFVERLQTSVMEETDEEFATTLPETGQVVRLMSIHQSKGLEFPVVIVADIDRKGPPRSKSAVLHPDFGALVKLPDMFGQSFENLGLKMFGLMEREADAEETIRLFYVACTRAADYLILSAGIDSMVKKRCPWLALVESRFDLTTGLPRIDPLLGSSEGSTAGRELIPDIRVHLNPPHVARVTHSTEKQVPIAQLGEFLRSDERAEIPELALRITRDTDELPPFSVSRLETIDAELRGIGHVRHDRQREPVDTPLDPDQATALGSLVHNVLERLNFSQASHWPQLLDEAVLCSADALNDDTIAVARQMLSRLKTSAVVSDLAEATSVQREVEFALRWPATAPGGHPTLIRGVIDLLYEDPTGGWHVLDYKTNDFSSHATDDQLLAPYELQLGIYAHAVTEWFGVVPCELSLISFRPTVRRIKLPWSEERWKQLSDRINASIAACRVP